MPRGSMCGMKFEWDPQKAESNLRKDGVSFQEGASVFGDPLSITYLDPDQSAAEHRFVTVGISRVRRVLIVAHTDRGDDVRIISVRRTTRREKRYYEEDK